VRLVKLFEHRGHVKRGVGSHRLLEGLSCPSSASDRKLVISDASVMDWSARSAVVWTV
jgi:hypothetical protein